VALLGIGVGFGFFVLGVLVFFVNWMGLFVFAVIVVVVVDGEQTLGGGVLLDHYLLLFQASGG
jgi:hypothetical protein